ncbi:MAG TPA: ABC transporter ATP-binding protein [Anaerolinea thermolimosa]|uniref:ABC transporter ATP-binding protein n=1 Tax=Anaerolinea thermolimosa TaxID=229919 RepID=A0A3D1JIL4_9CHLR|nr:ABC transporter ATP-binding protein [Anaerolinea thermolimosa]GAP05287.1 ABC-type polysaccharide/polyol phosphate transport system, ATPase component [Anaerolinea thermolimosa]HCE18352.1 ABC transporter ATP-binding protein [Anaerolinea thermolimosa]
MSSLAIRVEKLGKQYRIGTLASQRYQTLRDTLTSVFDRTRRGANGTIWALKDISFEVEQGQVLGIVGRNGAGKSTLLKILSRVTDPTEGYGEIRGRVGSLLEVGTGFHPELTGRENIYLNGAILGMRRSEIQRKFDEIVAFSEVGPFIDTPVKRYSSGMYLRLAFAVAAHLEPEILVVDEVLAVGDAEFQRKCLGKMSDVAQQGRTVLFVSHNMSAILRLTQETLVIEKGRLKMRAPTPQAVDYYLSQGFSQEGQRIWEEDEVPPEAAPFKPIAVRLKDAQGRVSNAVRSTEPFTIEVEYALSSPVTGLRVGLYLMSTRGEFIFTSFDTDDPSRYERYPVRPAGRYVSRCTIPADWLNEGRYAVGINASSFRVRRYFHDEQTLNFTVDATGAPGMQWAEPRLGPLRPRLDWQIEVMD